MLRPDSFHEHITMLAYQQAYHQLKNVCSSSEASSPSLYNPLVLKVFTDIPPWTDQNFLRLAAMPLHPLIWSALDQNHVELVMAMLAADPNYFPPIISDDYTSRLQSLLCLAASKSSVVVQQLLKGLSSQNLDFTPYQNCLQHAEVATWLLFIDDPRIQCDFLRSAVLLYRLDCIELLLSSLEFTEHELELAIELAYDKSFVSGALSLENALLTEFSIQYCVPRYSDTELFCQILAAVKTNNPTELATLIQQNSGDKHLLSTTVNTCEFRSRLTPLAFATAMGFQQCVDLLLQIDGIDLTIINRLGDTVLHHAARNGHSTIMESFLCRKLSPVELNQGNNFSHSPLHLAAINGHASCVAILICQDDIHIQNEYKFPSPLYSAVLAQQEECAKLLIQHPKSNLNDQEFPPLLLAVTTNQLNIVQAIVAEQKANVNIQDVHKRTPLYFAAAQGSTSIAQALLCSSNIDPNTCVFNPSEHEPSWSTPLTIAITNNRHDVVRSLLDWNHLNGNSLLQSRSGLPVPLTCAAILQDCDMMQLLLQYEEIDPNLADLDTGRSALSFVIANLKFLDNANSTSLINALVSCPRLDLNLQSRQVPLIQAIFFKPMNPQLKIVIKLLLQQPSIDVNRCQEPGSCPIAAAIEMNDMETLKLILKTPGLDVQAPCRFRFSRGLVFPQRRKR